jgi:glyoxylase-like metal-dependent hydrolase (beta-lactamase superfamily II)/rhodanese-related sulfurtransferase
MILEQIYLGCLAHASYLVGDERTGAAAVVDPRRDVDIYIGRAAELGLRIGYVVLTHFHADFVAGHLELRDRVGARICLGARAVAGYDFIALAGGDSIDLGGVRLDVIETPGHTPESISLLVYDLDHDGERPHAVLTGDTLFIGDVGRPDLAAAGGGSATDLAGQLYDSLHDKLLTLPDDTFVYPAHGAGSLCGKNLSTDLVSTIGRQRRDNAALQPMTRHEFVAAVTADQPDMPAYFPHDAALNAAEHAALADVLIDGLRPLSLDAALGIDGVQVLDTRDADSFAAAHVRGSINIGLDGSFAAWAGAVLDGGRPIVLVTEAGRERESALRLGRIGFDRVAGFLLDGIGACRQRLELVENSTRTTAATLSRWLEHAAPPLLVDVRTEREWQENRIGGSVNLPLASLPARLDELPRGRRLVVLCRSGYRSSIAASVLRRNGFGDVVDLAGGMDAWATASA